MAANESPDPIDVEVGARIRVRRKFLSLSLSALGDALGLTFKQVQKYELGVNRVSVSMLVKIAIKLETTVAALVGENDIVHHSHEVYQHIALPWMLELVTQSSALTTDQRKILLAVAKEISGKT